MPRSICIFERLAPVALTLLTSCASTRSSLSISGEQIELIDLSSDERRTLSETFAALVAIDAAPVRIDAAEYARGSAFERVFGFAPSGAAIWRWWCQRIQRIEKGGAWTVAVHDGQNGIVVREDFFSLPLVDRLSVLIHEARHADAGGFRHDDCPPDFGLVAGPACDALPLGAYTFQAAFLFELYARGQLDPARAQRGYLEARRRVLAAYPSAAPSVRK